MRHDIAGSRQIDWIRLLVNNRLDSIQLSIAQKNWKLHPYSWLLSLCSLVITVKDICLFLSFPQEAMDKFFAEPVPFETKLWRGLLYTFFGLGVLATMAAIARWPGPD